MTTLKFKTNINCISCVEEVSPFLDKIPSLLSYKIDTANPEKLLTITGERLKAKMVRNAVREAGYKIFGEKNILNRMFGIFKKSCCE